MVREQLAMCHLPRAIQENASGAAACLMDAPRRAEGRGLDGGIFPPQSSKPWPVGRKFPGTALLPA